MARTNITPPPKPLQPEILLRTIRCGWGGQLGPIACWLRCVAVRREWELADMVAAVAPLRAEHITDLWNGIPQAMTHAYRVRLVERLSALGKELDVRLHRPLLPTEIDELDAAITSEATAPRDWERDLARAGHGRPVCDCPPRPITPAARAPRTSEHA